MFSSGDTLSLSFKWENGCFLIQPKRCEDSIFRLIVEMNGKVSRLSDFCSISDAFKAVSNQETGFSDWDRLEPQEVPSQVHNIASWNFEQYLGTFSHAKCS